METLEEVRASIVEMDITSARETLEAFLAPRTRQRGEHHEAALMAVELGMVRIALRELNLALRDRPEHPDTLRELAALHRDRADRRGELGALERLEALGVLEHDEGERLSALRGLDEAPSHVEHEKSDTDTAPSDDDLPAMMTPDDADLVRFWHLFAGREDVHARQWFQPGRGVGYSPIRQPLTPSLLRAHVEGAVTLGVYPIRLDGTVTFFALDLDITRNAIDHARGDLERTRRLRRMVHKRGLVMQRHARERFGLELVLEDSGYKGRHLWGFLRDPLPASLVHRFVVALASALAPEEAELQVEAFPRQGRVEAGGLGNLIKLPLGIHLRSGRRASLLGEDGRADDSPWETLQRARRHERDEILRLLDVLRGLPTPAAPTPDDAPPWPMPAPLPPEAPFTEVDLETHPEVSTLLEGCAVLKALAQRALEHRRLDHDERIVLRHTFGHVASAVPAVNYLFSRCPEIPAQEFVQRPLRGSPISCPKIRKRIPDVTASVPCHCVFPTRPEHYPTPILHLDEARARGRLDRETLSTRDEDEPARAVLPEELARTYLHLRERIERLEHERDEVRRTFLTALERFPDRTLHTAEGDWFVRDEEGMPVLCWRPLDGEEE